MLVVDTSAFVSLGIAECHGHVLEEFDVHTTATVENELVATAEHDDVHGDAARAVLDRSKALTIHTIEDEVPTSASIDAGEGSCVTCCRTLDAGFLITDDLRALPELQQLVAAEVALSPIVLRALVNRGVLEPADARDDLETIAETRSWLGAPIYRRALRLFEDG